jgi:hypothetical protein
MAAAGPHEEAGGGALMGKIIDRVRKRERDRWLTKALAEAEESHRRLLLERLARPAAFIPTCGTDARLIEKIAQAKAESNAAVPIGGWARWDEERESLRKRHRESRWDRFWRWMGA